MDGETRPHKRVGAYAVTVSENMIRVYRDGVLIGEQALTADITALTQGSNYIGKSQYDWDAISMVRWMI